MKSRKRRVVLNRGKFLRSHRSGAVTLESILGLPILLITIFAIFLFGFILIVQQGVTHAAIEAAREAAKVPSTVSGTDTVEDAAVATADEVLSIYGLTVSGGSPNAELVVEDSSGSAWIGDAIVAPTGGCGVIAPPAYLFCATSSVGDPSIVRVRVIVSFASIPIPNLLGVFGWNTSGSYFDVTSDAVR
jgi:Flp pilus assembly protein TadG